MTKLRDTLVYNKINGNRKLVSSEDINKSYLEEIFEFNFREFTPIFQAYNSEFAEYIDINIHNFVEIKDTLKDVKGTIKLQIIKKEETFSSFVHSSVGDNTFNDAAMLCTPNRLNSSHSAPYPNGLVTPKKTINHARTSTPCKTLLVTHERASIPSKTPPNTVPTYQEVRNFVPAKIYTKFSISQSKFEENRKLKIALKEKKTFTKGPKGWMLEIILNELVDKKQDNFVGFKSAGAFVFNEYRVYYSNAKDEHPQEFVNYYANSLKVKKTNERRRKLVTIEEEVIESENLFKERYGYPCYISACNLNYADSEEDIENLKKCDWNENANEVESLLKKTFGIRRTLVTSESVSTQQIISTFPSLFSVKQFKAEASRLMGCTAVVTKITDRKLKFFANDILPLEIEKIRNSKFLSSLEHIRTASSTNSNEVQNLRIRCSLGEIAVLLHEDPANVYGYEAPTLPTMTPYILMNKENAISSLIVNGEAIIQDINLLDMAFVWCAVFPILNLECPTKCKKTYMFLSMALLKWQPLTTSRKPLPLCINEILYKFDDLIMNIEM